MEECFKWGRLLVIERKAGEKIFSKKGLSWPVAGSLSSVLVSWFRKKVLNFRNEKVKFESLKVFLEVVFFFLKKKIKNKNVNHFPTEQPPCNKFFSRYSPSPMSCVDTNCSSILRLTIFFLLNNCTAPTEAK